MVCFDGVLMVIINGDNGYGVSNGDLMFNDEKHLSISLFFFKGLVGHPSPGGPVRVGQRLGRRGAGGSGAEAAEVGGGDGMWSFPR
jgi:hypothetical protein